MKMEVTQQPRWVPRPPGAGGNGGGWLQVWEQGQELLVDWPQAGGEPDGHGDLAAGRSPSWAGSSLAGGKPHTAPGGAALKFLRHRGPRQRVLDT